MAVRTAAFILIVVLSQQNVRGSSNVATGKTAYASSFSSSSCKPAVALDGTTKTYFHSKANDISPWWSVDLGSSMHIRQVVISGRNYGEFLHYSIVGVTNTSPASLHPFPWGYQICATYFDGAKGAHSITLNCRPNVKGRFVVIQMLARFGYLILAEVAIYTYPDKGNIAKGKKALESSSLNGTSLAMKACDGSRANSAKANQCSITKVQTDPWWAVDLGSVHAIKSVTITSRSDCCYSSLHRFVIGVSNTSPARKKPAPGNYPLCNANNAAFGMGSSRSFSCSSVVMGRYIIIQIPARHSRLTLCEVEVYTY